jgi:LacI family transcriptional regulator
MAATKKVTIQDIAESANVSISTVSRVLTGNAPVAEKKREAVLAAIEALNYRPNVFARGLASGRSMAIGVLTQNIGSPFYETIMSGILQGLDGSGYSLIFTDGLFQPEREKEALQMLLDRRVDGLIVLGGRSPEDLLCEVMEIVPLIIIGRNIPCLSEYCMHMDQFQGAHKATSYLINLGHRQIAHITGILLQQDAIDRREGYLKALQDAGIERDPELIIEGDFLEQSGVLAIEILLTRSRTFSAIFAANDQMASGARLALSRHGIRVPEDVSIIGFDDQPHSAYMVPPLTTVRQPATEMGEAGARAILNLLQGVSFALPELPVELVIRESVARYR